MRTENIFETAYIMQRAYCNTKNRDDAILYAQNETSLPEDILIGMWSAIDAYVDIQSIFDDRDVFKKDLNQSKIGGR